MKRLVCVTLALSLLGATAVSARSYHHGGHYGGGYSHGYGHRGGHDNTGALIGLGVGLFALGAIAASQQDHYYDRYEYGPPPPPPGYGQPYGYGYGY